MKGWKEVKISDMGRVITGNTPPRKNPELYGSHTIFIKPTDISEGKKYTYHPEECYSELGFKKYKNSLISKGSTCVVTIGSIGKKMTKAHCDCFINQAVNAVVPNHEYDEEFIYYVLKYNLEQLKALDSGTASGRENVSKSSFSNINVNAPIDKSIQTKIGIILSAYDDLIDNNLKRIKLLEELAQCTYEEWFVKFILNGEQLELNEETGLPEGWGKIKVGSCIDNIKSSGKTLSTEIRNKGKYPVIDQSRDFIAGFIDDESKLVKSNKPIIVFGDHTRILKFINFPFVRGADGTQVILSNNVRMPQHLFYHMLMNLNLSNYHYARHYKFLKECEIILPTLEIADYFEYMIKPQFDLIRILRIQNQFLKESCDVLLPRMMSGKIEVDSDTSTSLSVRGKS